MSRDTNHVEVVDAVGGTKRADEVRDLPHVQAWLRAFRKVCTTQPKEVWVFVAAGTPCIMAKTPDGERFMLENDGVDPAAMVDLVTRHGEWDGGDW